MAKRCEFRKCLIEGTPAIIRKKIVCKRCYYIFKKDNYKRQQLGIKIPKKLVLLPEIIKQFETELKEEK